MKLFFIHGRSQEGKNPETLRLLWINTLKKGLEESSLSLPVEEDIIFLPFYGDLLDELVTDYNLPLENINQKGGISDSREIQFLNDLLSEVSDNAGVTNEDIKQEIDAVETEKSALNWKWVRAILKAIDKKEKWSEATLKKFTLDVFLYLTNPNIRQEIDTIVKKDMDTEPCIVVGHSLGSIIAYNILKNNPNLEVVKFFTLGSPLGLSSVKKYLSPIKMPECVVSGDWYNAFDKRDFVALRPLDKNNFNIDPEITNYGSINNHTPNRHGIEGYLNDKTVAEMIYKALSR
ncbi:MAG: hypothetical protein QM710_04595 [Flavobacterium sp.]